MNELSESDFGDALESWPLRCDEQIGHRDVAFAHGSSSSIESAIGSKRERPNHLGTTLGNAITSSSASHLGALENEDPRLPFWNKQKSEDLIYMDWQTGKESESSKYLSKVLPSVARRNYVTDKTNTADGFENAISNSKPMNVPEKIDEIRSQSGENNYHVSNFELFGNMDGTKTIYAKQSNKDNEKYSVFLGIKNVDGIKKNSRKLDLKACARQEEAKVTKCTGGNIVQNIPCQTIYHFSSTSRSNRFDARLEKLESLVKFDKEAFINPIEPDQKENLKNLILQEIGDEPGAEFIIEERRFSYSYLNFCAIKHQKKHKDLGKSKLGKLQNTYTTRRARNDHLKEAAKLFSDNAELWIKYWEMAHGINLTYEPFPSI